MNLYRVVHSGAEFREYEFHWRSHNTLPDGVASVVVNEVDELPVEFFVRVTPCEHGNYAPHPIDAPSRFRQDRCDGKPEEDNDA